MFAYSYKVVNITISIYLNRFIFKINTDVVYNPSEVQFPTDVDTHGKIEKAGPTSAMGEKSTHIRVKFKNLTLIYVVSSKLTLMYVVSSKQTLK